MEHPRTEGTVRDGVTRRAVLRGAGLGSVVAALIAAGWTVEAHAQEATPLAVTAEPNAIVVLFGQPIDVAAFEEHYLTVHRPLALQMPHLLEILGGPVLGTLEGGESEYQRIAILRFTSLADLEAAVASPEGQEAFGDVPNFATGGVTAFLTHLDAVAPAPTAAGTPVG